MPCQSGINISKLSFFTKIMPISEIILRPKFVFLSGLLMRYVRFPKWTRMDRIAEMEHRNWSSYMPVGIFYAFIGTGWSKVPRESNIVPEKLQIRYRIVPHKRIRPVKWKQAQN